MERLSVTTILAIRPRPGREAACLQWMQETAAIANTFPGFLGTEIYRSVADKNLLVNVFTFRDVNTLDQWENSAERARQAAKGEPLVEQVVEKHQLTTLDSWSLSPPNATATPPVRWKVVLVTVAVIFLLLNSLVPVLQQLFSRIGFPILVRSLLGVVIMVSLMTYLIMPAISRQFSGWLTR